MKYEIIFGPKGYVKYIAETDSERAELVRLQEKYGGELITENEYLLP